MTEGNHREPVKYRAIVDYVEVSRATVNLIGSVELSGLSQHSESTGRDRGSVRPRIAGPVVVPRETRIGRVGSRIESDGV